MAQRPSKASSQSGDSMAPNSLILELASLAIAAVPRSISEEKTKMMVKNPGPWQQEVRALLLRYNPTVSVVPQRAKVESGTELDPSPHIELWLRLLHDVFGGLTFDPKSLVIPRVAPGSFKEVRLIVVPEALASSPGGVFETLAHTFSCRCVCDYPDQKHQSQLRPSGTYAIWADDEIMPSNNEIMLPGQMIGNQVAHETLVERLLHELAYCNTTGGHLDTHSSTITSSVSPTGDPYFCAWLDRSFRVGLWRGEMQTTVGRQRQVVIGGKPA